MAAEDHSPIYEDLIRFKPEGMTPNAWAVRAGVSRTVWTDMRRHGNPSRRTLEKLLAAAGSSLAEFEALRVHGAPAAGSARSGGLSDRHASGWGGPQVPPLPVVATATAGLWGDPVAAIEATELRTGELVDRVPRPASLADDAGAYAIMVVGNAMWPRFRAGRRIAVSPKAPVAIGDDVLVRLKPRGSDEDSGERTAVLIKELVRKSGSGVELRQFNPDATFHIDAKDIAAIEKVLGELV
jgi:phage repressor protein C with HTH and peptisase S24 domain